MATPDEELDEIVKEYGACLIRALAQVSYDHLSVTRNRNQAVQAIKEWSCKHRGCEPEQIKDGIIKGKYGLLDESIRFLDGPCKHCGKEKV